MVLRRAFTLTELLVALGIAAMLAGVSIPINRLKWNPCLMNEAGTGKRP